MNIKVVKGDITKVSCDVIVNPANSLMIMGGGVAAAIKAAGGEIIEKEAIKKAPVPIGDAVVTTAGRLNAKYVIHAPTMERPAMKTSYEKVRMAIEAALKAALDLNVRCIAFPGMGTGVGGLSPNKFVEAFLEAINKYKYEIEQKGLSIIVVAYTQELYDAAKKLVFISNK